MAVHIPRLRAVAQRLQKLADFCGTFLQGNDGEAKAVCLKKRSQEIQSSQPEL